MEPAWWTLWHACPDATPFQSPSWLIPWWDVFAPGQLAGVAIWDDEKLVAFAPFYLEDGQWGRRLLPMGIGISDYMGPLIAPDYAGAGEMLMRGFLDLPLPWDSLEFEELAPDAAGRSVPTPPGCSESGGAQSPCPGLEPEWPNGTIRPADRNPS